MNKMQRGIINKWIGISAVTFLVACGVKVPVKDVVMSRNQIVYPETKREDKVFTYFNANVEDPYYWLEDDRSLETEEWVIKQNETTFGYLNEIPYRNQFVDRMTQLWNYERISAPFIRGNYTYFYKNDGLQNQSVVYRKNEDGVEEIFLNPNTFSNDGTSSLDGLSFSKDGSLCAYTVSIAGSDWRTIFVLNAETKELLSDRIVDAKFTSVSWLNNSGFYYSSYDKPEGSQLSAKTDQHKLYFHELGTQQNEDKVIFGLKDKYRYIGGYVTENQQYLIISGANTTSSNNLFYQKIGTTEIYPIATEMDGDYSVMDADRDNFYILTNYQAPNKRLITTPIVKASDRNVWQDLIAEKQDVMSISKGGGYLFAHYISDAITRVDQYEMNGKFIRAVELPGFGTASGWSGTNEDEKLYFSFTNYYTPSSVYSFDLKTGVSTLYNAPNVDFKSSDYESKQVFYTSKDGTKVPMIITYKKGLVLDGTNPTILYGYGGFNISLTPSFSVANAVWLEAGGVYAVANLRGGGEYGKRWHNAGTQMKKQNVFDDFIAAAEYLIKEKYTSPAYLASSGRSNGGLLVGATMTQRPDLFQVALPGVGVLDMLRYHTFTAGAGWGYDYGTAEDSPEMFKYLKNYSPVHNVKKGVKYPATLVTTGDHDDRVVPAHSYKFIAELQEKQMGDNPVLIRIDVNAGHGAGKPISMTIQEYSDMYSFTLFNMGIKTIDFNK